MRSLLVINPYAASGKALKAWQSHETAIRAALGDLDVHISQAPADVEAALLQATERDVRRVISMGGDGTNHSVLNALVRHNERFEDAPLAFACLPIGTGSDWARGLGMPLTLPEALHWLAQAQARPMDIGMMEMDGHREAFLNIASGGVSYEVDVRVNAKPKRTTWSFLQATLAGLWHYQPQHLRVTLDGAPWYEGDIVLLALCNGRYFGQGMHVAPQARPDDGLLEVILAEAMPLARLLPLLVLLYQGKHLGKRGVHYAQAKHITLETQGAPLGLDLDGEACSGQHITCTVQHHWVRVYG